MQNQTFHIMAKPVSHRCNLKCDYCFYLEKEAYYPSQDRMSRAQLEHYVKNYIEGSPQAHVDFAWQGGEPTLAGLDFYKEAVRLQKKYGVGKKISNSFQTNGIAINNQWAEFFAQNNFLIGISVDGDASIHDKYRISTNGKPTFEMLLAQKFGYPAGLCIFSQKCGDNLILEANGDVYSCDHYVYPVNKVGNIKESSLKTLASSTQQREFGQVKLTTLTNACKQCKYLTQCYGGCPKQRIDNTGDQYHHNYLCSSYQRIFKHTDEFISATANKLRRATR